MTWWWLMGEEAIAEIGDVRMTAMGVLVVAQYREAVLLERAGAVDGVRLSRLFNSQPGFMRHEGLNLALGIAGQVVLLEQNSVLEGLVRTSKSACHLMGASGNGIGIGR
jgi:hypothetical protein